MKFLLLSIICYIFTNIKNMNLKNITKKGIFKFLADKTFSWINRITSQYKVLE